FRRAIQLDPNYATAHQWYAESLAFQGRFDEALVESEKARKLDPVSPIIAADCGAILLFSRQYDRAIEKFRTAKELDPQIGRAHLLAYAFAKVGKYQEALAETRSWKRSEDVPWTFAVRAAVYGQMGQKAQADRELRRLRVFLRGEPNLDPALMYAIGYAAIGD